LSPSPAALELRGIHKTFRPRQSLREVLHLSKPEPVEVLKGVDLRVEKGSVIGIMGPNGSGKSTLLRIASGILQPDEGRLGILGKDPSASRAETSRLIGYLSSSERSFYWRLSALENLRFFGKLHDMRGKELDLRIGGIADSLGVKRLLDRRFQDLSTGFRQRIGLARALLHDPELVILDEPTKSLDSESSDGFRELLSRLALRGRTVIMATHSLREAVQLCDRSYGIVDGKLSQIDAKTEPETAEVRVELSGTPSVEPPDGAIIVGRELSCPLAVLADVLCWVRTSGVRVTALHLPEDKRP
jgi:ABC-type multidrug transport system ATPase subunit